mmetsp:Transcript_69535/g.153777  ORF Transcript_69535/g.153777 Transcript_69535/m.153777 type:complete len:258 (+) Transcript_69535:1943-2716(+)
MQATRRRRHGRRPRRRCMASRLSAAMARRERARLHGRRRGRRRGPRAVARCPHCSGAPLLPTWALVPKWPRPSLTARHWVAAQELETTRVLPRLGAVQLPPGRPPGWPRGRGLRANPRRTTRSGMVVRRRTMRLKWSDEPAPSSSEKRRRPSRRPRRHRRAGTSRQHRSLRRRPVSGSTESRRRKRPRSTPIPLAPPSRGRRSQTVARCSSQRAARAKRPAAGAAPRRCRLLRRPLQAPAPALASPGRRRAPPVSGR